MYSQCACAVDGQNVSLAGQSASLIQKLDAWMQWVSEEPRIGGIVPYKWERDWPKGKLADGSFVLGAQNFPKLNERLVAHGWVNLSAVTSCPPPLKLDEGGSVMARVEQQQPPSIVFAVFSLQPSTAAKSDDVSSDSVLLASAGQDKNIRVWGLDFGDCHRSIHAHDDSVMALKFVNKTHYAFTCGKDKRVRYWDLDKYEMLLSLDEHHMAVWTIAISSTGAFLVSAGADRSLRLYERTKEPFFLDEEKEKRLDSMFEDTAGIEMDEEDRKNSERLDLQNGTNDDSDAHNVITAESGLAGRRTMETLDSADKICAAVDLAKHELERIAAYENEKRQSADPSKMPPLKPNPLLLNMEPRQYALYQVSQVRPAELERSILCLPFLYCRLLLDYLKYWLERNERVELCCTMTNLIVRLHFQQLGATREARATLDGLKPLLRSRAKERLDDLGFNIAGMEMIERSAKTKAET